MEQTQLKNIVFDLGGVIINLDRDACVRRFAQLQYPQAADLLDPYTQSGIFLKLEEGLVTPDELYAYIRKEGGNHLTPEAINSALYEFLVDIPDYKIDLLPVLRQRFKVYMLSNTNPIMFPYIVKRWFSKPGRSLEECFDRCFLSYEMKMVKPSPEIFQHMLALEGLRPGETLFLDDGPANIEEAKRQGFKTYLVTAGEDYRSLFA